MEEFKTDMHCNINKRQKRKLINLTDKLENLKFDNISLHCEAMVMELRNKNGLWSLEVSSAVEYDRTDYYVLEGNDFVYTHSKKYEEDY